MRIILMLIKKEFLQVFRNRLLISILIVAPLVQFLIFPFTADYEIKHISIAFWDQDHSTLSREIIEHFRHSSHFIDCGFIDSEAEKEEALLHDHVDFILQFPPHFEKQMVRGEESQIAITANAINSVKAGIGSDYIKNVLTGFFESKEEGTPPSIKKMTSISINHIHWYNEKMNYQNIMVPGILVILVTLIGSYVTALNIVREKEIGTIEQINVTPILKWQFLVGKMIPFWILGMLEFIVGLILMVFFFGISIQGSTTALLGATAIYLLVMLGLGFFISFVSKNQLQAMFIVFFLFVIYVLLSGLFTPTEGMPEWAKWINFANPMSFYMDIIKLVILKGAGLREIASQVLILSGMAVGINIAALLSYSDKIN